jgi:hypothetical protein
MTKRYLAVAMAAAVVVAAVLIGLTSYDKNGKEFPWLPFATDSGGRSEMGWLMFVMPPPIEFQSHADCKARIAQFLQSDYPDASAYQPPYGCAYHGNSFLYVYVVNWLYDGNLLDGCLAKHIVSSTDSGSEPLYDPAVLIPDKAESGATWYCVAKWPGATESRARTIARQLAACQQHDTGWRHVSSPELKAHLTAFNAHCAELGIKTDCKMVVMHSPGETADDPFTRAFLDRTTVQC